MEPVISPVAGDQYPAADYETLQQRAIGMRLANYSGAAAGSEEGGDCVTWWRAAGLVATDRVQIDTAHDWRNRVIEVAAVTFASADQRPRGSASYVDWGTLTQGRVVGWLGSGGYSNVTGAGTAVGFGAPPLAATGGVTSYRVTVATNIYLYVDPTTGGLYAYNANGSDVHLALIVRATGVVAA
jgi:hypothetical protein